MPAFLHSLAIVTALATAVTFALPQHAVAASAAEITKESQTALNKLYANNPGAEKLGPKAVGILVFPGTVKAGLGVGGQFGEGVLFRGGKATAYYNTAGGSFGCKLADRYTGTRCSF